VHQYQDYVLQTVMYYAWGRGGMGIVSRECRSRPVGLVIAVRSCTDVRDMDFAVVMDAGLPRDTAFVGCSDMPSELFGVEGDSG
jgi:hypothetical protein